MKFYSPYQFIPILCDPEDSGVPTHSYQTIKEGAEKYIRHDRWEADALSGRIICTLRTESPTLVGAEQKAGQRAGNGQLARPGHVKNYRHDDRVALPASSLRGMTGNLVEILSRSAMRILRPEQHQYSVRKPMNKRLQAIGLLRRHDKQGLKIHPLALAGVQLEGNRVAAKWRRLFGAETQLNQCLAAYVGRYQGGGHSIRDLPENQGCFHGKANQEFYLADTLGGDSTLDDRIEAQPRGVKRRNAVLLTQEIDPWIDPLDLSDSIPADRQLGVLYITGGEGQAAQMPNKKHELFIPWPLKMRDGIELPPSVVEEFLSIARQCADQEQGEEEPDLPHLPTGYREFDREPLEQQWLADGDLLYFDIDDQGEISEISYSAIWRRVPGELSAALKSLHGKGILPWSKERSSLTPAEALLGVAEQETAETGARNLASRVRFYDALPEPRLKETELLEHEQKLKILASPKPPSPAMYFHRTSGGSVDKATLELRPKVTPSGHTAPPPSRPNGRKVYLPHRQKEIDARIWESKTSPGDKNDNQRLLCTPIRQDREFHFHVDFDNLSPAELALLLTALQPNPAAEPSRFLHRLGLGKPLGLGHVSLEVRGVFLVDRQQRYTPKGLSHRRYHRWWGDPTLTREQAITERFPQEAALVRDIQPDEPVLPATLIDGDTLALLRKASDPKEIAHQVSYPFSTDRGQTPATETDGYAWFVDNETHARRTHQSPKGLKPIRRNKPLPPLDSEFEP